MRSTTKNYKKNRIAVHRTNMHVYVQIIDDVNRKTLVSASDLEITTGKKPLSKIERAEQVGSLLAEKALKAKIKNVYFDRRQYKFHGRVQALAEGARKGGLLF